MQTFLTFIQDQWILSTIWIVLVGLLVLTELQRRARGPIKISTSQATTLINRQDALVIDLRDTAAYAKGHIIHAKSIPQGRLKDSTGQLSSHTDKPIILVCDMGHKSSAAGNELRKQGFSQIYCLSGGINAWQSAGLPLTHK